MQRTRSRKSPIGPIHALAAAMFAAGALSISAPAFAAPVGAASGAPSTAPSTAPSAISSADIILVQGRSGKGNRGGGKGRSDSHVFKKGGDRWNGNDWRRVERARIEDRRDDRGNHYGWDRGRHYGWDKAGKDSDFHDRRFGDRPDWRVERRDSRWTGHDIGRVESSVLRDYDAYNLPRPGPGQYYARSGDEIYLVTERTRQIIDAFMLRGLVR